MFVQHHNTASTSLSNSFTIKSEDFELNILAKSLTKITGIVHFQYLNQNFSANIYITPATIQLKGQQAFEGIHSSAPVISDSALVQKNYMSNGIISQTGIQNIIWLILDFIHLYNLIRLKPNSIFEIYRESFVQLKLLDAGLLFGKIDLESPFANQMSQLISQKLKRKHTYQISNSAYLLGTFQNIIANYPLQLKKQIKTNLLETILN